MIKKVVLISIIWPSLGFALEKTDALQVAFSEVAPYAFMESGHLAGINIRIADQIQKLSGLKLEYKIYPHARLSSALTSVAPDISVSLTGSCKKFSDAYEHVGHFYHIVPTLYLKSKSNPNDKTLRIGRMRGTCTTLMKENPQFENIVDVSDLKQALIMMELGRLEGLCAPSALMKYNLSQEPNFKEKLKIIGSQSDLSDFEAVLCRKKSLSVAVKTKLDLAIKKLKIDL